MKKCLFLAFVVCLFAFLSCSKEQMIIETSQSEFEYTFAISGSNAVDTKSTFDSDATGLFLSWQTGDNLTTITNSTSDPSGYSYSKSTVNAGSSPVTFTIKSHYALNKDDMVYCASPYISNPGTDPTSVSLKIPASQTQDSDTFDAAAMPLVAEPFPISAAIGTENGTNTESTVSFYNLGSVIEFDVFSASGTYSEENIESVTFSSSDEDDYICGSFSFDLTAVSSADGSSLAIDGYTGLSITVNVDEPLNIGSSTYKENAKKIYMVVAPGTHSGTVSIETNLAVYTYSVPSRDFYRGAVRRFGINLEKDGARGPKTMVLNITDFSLPSGSGYKSSTFSMSLVFCYN